MNSSRIDRVLQVLSLVALAPAPTPLKEIGARLGLHPSMVSRIVADLIAGGLLAKVTYRTVTGTPALAALGRSAGKNHPLTGIAREVLHKPMAEREKLSCEFATVVPGGFFHFYKVNRKVSAPELLWRSDLAAVIFAARGDGWEEVCAELAFAAPEGTDLSFPLFKERFQEAQENRLLVNYHGGRFWQVTLPVVCDQIVCALSVSGMDAADMDRSFCSGLAVAIRSRYKEFSNPNA